jgi:hypothetical protein
MKVAAPNHARPMIQAKQMARQIGRGRPGLPQLEGKILQAICARIAQTGKDNSN